MSTSRMRSSILAFNIHGFPAFAENDGRWFLSPEGAKCNSPGLSAAQPRVINPPSNKPLKGAIIRYRNLSPFQGWEFYWAIFPGRCPGLSHFAPSGQMQAYRKDFSAPAQLLTAFRQTLIVFTKIKMCFDSVFFFIPCLCFCLFRVNPWQMLLLLLLPSVPNSSFLQLKPKSRYFTKAITLWRKISCNPCNC